MFGPTRPERFELPSLPTLLQETEDEKSRRIAVVQKTAARFYRAVARQLGKAETAALFKRLNPHAKAGKREDWKRNAQLLRAYDEGIRAGANPKTLPREMATKIYPKKDDDRAASLARHIRRLVAKRAKRAAAAGARDLRAFRRIYRADPPPTLLSEWGTSTGRSRRTK